MKLMYVCKIIKVCHISGCIRMHKVDVTKENLKGMLIRKELYGNLDNKVTQAQKNSQT